MKILHVIHDIDPQSGGPTAAIRNIVREQAHQGHQVSLVTTDARSAKLWTDADRYLREMRADSAFAGVELSIGAAYGRRGLRWTYGYSPECRNWLRRRLWDRQLAPDVIQIHGIFSHITHLAAAMARARHIPYILCPAGSLDLDCYRSGHQVLKRLYTAIWLQKDLLRAAYVHATAPAEEQQLQRWVPEARIKLIPLGAELPALNPAAAEAGFLAAFPQLRGRRILLHVARINAIKRPELLVEALGILRDEYKDLVILFVGHASPHKQVVDELIGRLGLEGRVIYAGFLSGELKQWAFESARLFGLPSRHENFGVAVVEAMAHGVPVLVTPEVASHIHVDASGCGVTVPGNPEAIAEGIRRLLSADREGLGKKGIGYVKEHLTWPRVVQQLEALYELALANSP